MPEAAAEKEIDRLRANAETRIRAAWPNSEEPVHISVHSADLNHAGTTSIELLQSSTGVVRAVSAFFRSWEPGDVGITNDPDTGAMNATDFIAVAPVFRPNLDGWVAVRSRVPDFGGWEFGGYSPQAVDRWAEGARVEPVKLLAQGKSRREVTDLIKLNSRTPHVTENILSMMAEIALEISSEAELLEQHSLEVRPGEAARIHAILEALNGHVGEAQQAVAMYSRVADAVIGVRLRSDGVQLIVTIDAPGIVPHHINLGRYGAEDMVHAALAAALGEPRLSTESLGARLIVEVDEPSMAAALLPATVGFGRETTGQAIFRSTLRALIEAGFPTIDVDSAWQKIEMRILGIERVDFETGKLTKERAAATKKIMEEDVR